MYMFRKPHRVVIFSITISIDKGYFLHSKITMTGDVVLYYIVTALVPTLK